MKEELYEFLRFNKQEWLLLLLIAGANTGLWMYDITRSPTPIEHHTEYVSEQILDQSVEMPTMKNAKRISAKKHTLQSNSPPPQKSRSKGRNQAMKKRDIPMFEFNPNTISSDSLVLLGVPRKTAETWRKYVHAGGRFYKPDDIQKVFGLKEDQVEALIPWVRLPVGHNSRKRKNRTEAARSTRSNRIEINTSTAAQWQSLKGIGPYYSQKIVRYRSALGGFSSVLQVKETPHLPDSVFQKVYKKLYLTQMPKPIDINTADYITLVKHPYIHKKQASLIIKYRKQHGGYKNINEILKIRAIDSVFLQKIRPYFYVKGKEVVKR